MDEVVQPNLQPHSLDVEKTAALVRFAGKISHELNNIFTAVIGNLALLEHFAEDEDSTSAIDEVRKSAERGIGLSAKLQAFAGRQLLHPQPVDINAAIIRAVEPLLPSLLPDVDVVMNLAERNCVAAVDEEKFKGAIAELVRNARASMDKDGVLTVETRVPNGQVEIRVTDTGKGMPQHVLEHALDPLFSTKPSHLNAGWGLSQVAGFVRQLGGEINLKSGLGKGTCVTLRLPAILLDQASKKAQSATRTAALAHSWP